MRGAYVVLCVSLCVRVGVVCVRIDVLCVRVRVSVCVCVCVCADEVRGVVLYLRSGGCRDRFGRLFLSHAMSILIDSRAISYVRQMITQHAIHMNTPDGP